MNAVWVSVLVLVAITGCAAQGALQGSQPIRGSSIEPPAASGATVAPAPSPPQQEHFGPRLIIPVTGGPPVLGIPVGGNLYIPVTGGPPVPGMAIDP
jgi:hypothetical protein